MDERSVAAGGASKHAQRPPRGGFTRDQDNGRLADPRALTILTTEHWSLLAGRSLVYLLFATLILAFDLFIGLATLARIAKTNADDVLALQAMNRIRLAYLEMVPSLDPYISTGRYDDIAAVVGGVYGDAATMAGSPLRGLLHSLTSTAPMLGTITAGVGGGLAASLALLFDGAPGSRSCSPSRRSSRCSASSGGGDRARSTRPARASRFDSRPRPRIGRLRSRRAVGAPATGRTDPSAAGTGTFGDLGRSAARSYAQAMRRFRLVDLVALAIVVLAATDGVGSDPSQASTPAPPSVPVTVRPAVVAAPDPRSSSDPGAPGQRAVPGATAPTAGWVPPSRGTGDSSPGPTAGVVATREPPPAASPTASVPSTTVTAAPVPTPGPTTPPGSMPLPLSACPIFPASNVWNRPLDGLPMAASSATMVAAIGLDHSLHPDFSDLGGYGIPYNVVGAAIPRSSVSFDYDDESDHVGYPIPADPLIEGGSDRHLLLADTDECRLFELFAATRSGGSWHAGSGATWDLRSNALRPETWTSADAAGLPILAGLARYEEVAAGEIRHALRFTAPRTCDGYLYPARHDAGAGSCATYPPMGLRVRLRTDFDLSSFGPQARVVLVALQRYGAILADNGSAWYVTGAPSPGWDDDDLHGLHAITGADFEVVDTTGFVNG